MKTRSLLVLCCLAISAAGFAADKEVEALLAKMRDAYQKVKTAQFTATTFITGPFGEQGVTGKFSFANPNKIHALVMGLPAAGGNDVVLTSDGKMMQAEGLEGRSGKRKFDEQAIVEALPFNLETLNFWDYARQLSTGEKGNMHDSQLKIVKKESWNGKSWVVLEETAPKSRVFVRYFIDPKTNLMWRTVVMDIDKKETQFDVQLKDLTLGVKLNDKLFKID